MYVGTSHPIKVCKTYEILSWTSKLEGREITKSRNLVNALVTWRRMPALAVFFLAVHICVNLSFYLYLFSLFVYPFHSISFSFFFLYFRHPLFLFWQISLFLLSLLFFLSSLSLRFFISQKLFCACFLSYWTDAKAPFKWGRRLSLALDKGSSQLMSGLLKMAPVK
jgi:hypothetical protein